MLRRLIDTSYRFAIIDKNQVLRAFVETRSRVNNHLCGLQANQKRINFSYSQYYSQRKNRNDVGNNNTDPNEKDKKGWTIASFSLLAASIMAYLLINSQASADQEEDVKELETNGVGSNVHLDILSKKLLANLPSVVENYVDFQGKKELLDENLNTQDIMVISGAGGMGKSTLAAQYGNDCHQECNTQVIWIKGTQMEEEFFRLARILRIQTDGLDTEIIRNLIYGNLEKIDQKKILLIFDNVEKKEKIEKYLISLPNNAKVIITSRNGNLLEGIKHINVEGFNKEEALFYLKKTLETNEEETKKIINVVGESPFRLSIVAAYFKNHPLTSVDELTAMYHNIKKGYSENEEIYPEVELLFRNLKKEAPKAWELLKYLAYLDAEGVVVSFVGEMMQQTVGELEDCINKLRELSLMKVVEGSEKLLKVTHRIVQTETKKAVIEEDKKQVVKILEKLISELDKVMPSVDENPENWGKVMEVVSHAKVLIEEAKEIDQATAGRASLLSKIWAYFYYITFNYKEAINYGEELLKNQRSIHRAGHPDVAKSLDNIGMAYRDLGGTQNIQKGLQYLKESLEMRQELYPDDHPDVALSRNNLGGAYFYLGGTQNIQKGLQYLKESLEMRQRLYRDNHHDIALSLNNVGMAYQALGGAENLKKGVKYLKDSLKMFRGLYPDDHPDVALSLNNLGMAYQDYKLKKGLPCLEASFQMRQALFFGNHRAVASSLNNVGLAYKNLGGADNLKKGLQYLEESLKMRQALFPGNHSDVASSLMHTGLAYQKLGDSDKALEYLKQAYCINSSIFDEDYTKTKEIKSAIESLQPDFFVNQGPGQILQQQYCLGGNRVGPECRQMIASRQTMNDELMTLKQGIQYSLLNDIVKTVDDYGWTNIGLFGSDWGVKGYIEKRYLEGKLKRLGNNSNSDNIELAQMLCFESMNLGIMKSINKPFAVVEGFTRENPELVQKIAVEHPEFFVDGSIVEACVRAMPNDAAFAEHLFKHVKYMGMEASQEKGFKN